MAQLVWLITGCSTGFGSVLAQQALARGDKVIATARRPSTVEHLQPLGAATLQLDVTDPESTSQETVAKAIAIHGRIDVLVNNAGYVGTGSWEEIKYEDFVSQFETNVFGVLKVTRAALPHLRERRSGTMVFISSRSGWVGDPFCAPYSGSKFALEGMVECLAKETEHLGIKTLLVAPGRFRTNLLSPGNVRKVQSSIPGYQEKSASFNEALSKEDRMQPGDTDRGVEIIIDAVKGEGSMQGGAPLRLLLGTDCYESVKEKCEETLGLLEKWKDVITSTDHAE